MRRLFRGFLRRVRPVRHYAPAPRDANLRVAEAAAPVPVAADPAAVDTLARPAVERLVEDEALRGELTDDGFGPVIDWVSRLLIAAAGRALGSPDPGGTMEQAAGQARALARAVAQAADDGDLDPLRAALAPPLLAAQAAARASVALDGDLAGDADPDARARLLVERLRAATEPGT